MTGAPLLFGLVMSAGAQLAWVLLWLVLVTMLVVALVIVALSRWGRSQPIRICVVLSLLIHVLLAGYAATIQIVGIPREVRGSPAIDVSFVDDDGESTDPASASAQTLDNASLTALPAATVAPTAELPRVQAEAPPLLGKSEPAAAPQLLSAPKATDDLPPVAVTTVASSAPKIPAAEVQPAELPSTIETPTAKSEPEATTAAPNGGGPDRVAAEPVSSDLLHDADNHKPLPGLPDLPPSPNSAAGPNKTAGSTNSTAGADATPAPAVSGLAAGGTALAGLPGPAVITPANIPAPYQMRVDADRVKHGARRGGSPEAEAAVQAGLRWLSLSQSDNGRWEASRFGAGRELKVDGSDRQGAGSAADTGVTGLALLAFLGAGNTHLNGPYKENVRRGLEYLMSIQRTDGSLSGNARLYEAMYCHGMASFALSEACAMTGDPRLRAAVSRAAAFIVASQHPTTGGWRYQPGDPGDTSQLGWQVMALRSAELAGIQFPDRTRDGVRRFLVSVASGEHGGLASYRPGEKTSRTMTAEALACRQFMGVAQQEPQCQEAADFVLQQLPGDGEANLYYWYYATVSLYQLQDEHWLRWNQAMQQNLLAMQRHDDDLAGSWDTDSVWGGYGGRVFTTSLATLCLEVYYRYLPLYSAHKPPDQPLR